MSKATPNRADSPQDYPGLGLPLFEFDQGREHYSMGAHSNCHGAQSELIFIREVAMMDVMDKLTDKPDWDKKVFDEKIVAKWRKEALSIPNEAFWALGHCDRYMDARQMPANILDETAFECCIQELRSKAKYFAKTGIIPTLDATATVAKSDSLVTPELHESLRAAFDKLQSEQAATPDWHPNSGDMVQDLVHPSMYPLVYGRSRVFKEECVGVEDAIQKWAGKGDVIGQHSWEHDEERDRFRYGVGAGDLSPAYWSQNYQWLPANVSFTDDGGVKLTSYINNLHPNRHADIYRTIEKLIVTSLPMWDQCLAMTRGYMDRDGAGRTENRIALPGSMDDEDESLWIPSNIQECANLDISDEDLEEQGWYPHDNDEDEEYKTEYKWKAVRKAKLPEASYTDIDYCPEVGKRLCDRFRETGLQIIVKLASIELTPAKPHFSVGGWHIEGQMNEHICATALYYLDSENITSSNLSFRMQTDPYTSQEDAFQVGQESYHWMESAFCADMTPGGGPCLQDYGSVDTREGRLLAFPNVFQHRVSPFELVDEMKPGHRRFIALWLVDPTQRIISTANVPPQQMSWYVDSILGETQDSRKESLEKLPSELVNLLHEKAAIADRDSDEGAIRGNAKLPEELMEMVRIHFDANGEEMPMSVEEAREHRAKLMQERSAFHSVAEDGWRATSYGFCEH